MKNVIIKVPEQFFSTSRLFTIPTYSVSLNYKNITQMEIELIDTGFFYADGGAMFGAIPKTSWSRRYPSNETNGCVLAMRSILIKSTDGRIILIDTGAGNKHLKLLSYYQFFDLADLGEELQKRGVTRESVTDVVLTHLHFDHCGYVTFANSEGNLSLAFPNATHWVSQPHWKSFIQPHPLEKDSFRRENMDLAAEKGCIRFIDSNTPLCPEVMLTLYNGHTEGQIVPYITGKDRTYVFAGDVIPLAASVSPHWISAYDINAKQSYDEKIRLLEQAVQNQQAVFFCHDAYTFCATIKKVGNYYKADAVFDLQKYE